MTIVTGADDIGHGQKCAACGFWQGRIADLQDVNNREVERRRKAEEKLMLARKALEAAGEHARNCDCAPCITLRAVVAFMWVR